MKALLINRIPSLDGLRAVSILLVLIGHAFHIKSLDIANLGVRIFFVISAYLIVGILLKDVERKKFSIKVFYFKRFTRTFPAFYVYLLVLFFVLKYLGLFEWEQFWRAPVYLENYHPRSLWNSNQWFVGHTWSLAVEEQFYVLVALLFYFFNKKVINKGQLVYILFCIVFLVPIIRICYLLFPWIPEFLRGSIHRSFETVVDSLAVGGLIAICSTKIISNKFYRIIENRTWMLIIIIILMQSLNGKFIVDLFGLKSKYFYNLFGLTVLNFAIGILILVLINNPKRALFSRFLNLPFMVKIGLWSYSIYLWQQVWLYSWDIPLVFKILGIFVCSIISYYLVEIKFLSWRDNILKKNERN
ncbi:acyltransferase family protein [Flavobacterium sp. PLA-1-15]|uniref:acyltransferase family protein n=1 Tax=Flavobacterium sp. PLA-1-15 TaxID=3380533 RepID=UPI003B782883